MYACMSVQESKLHDILLDHHAEMLPCLVIIVLLTTTGLVSVAVENKNKACTYSLSCHKPS